MSESLKCQAQEFGLDSMGNREPLITLSLDTEHCGSILERPRRISRFKRNSLLPVEGVFSCLLEVQSLF